MRLRLPSPRARRGLIAVLALLGQAATTFGMPLPASRHKDTSRPFPCMNHSCGCMSLEDFWHSCCCYSNAEKLAWADANGVWAPDFVREAANREEAIARKAKKKSCCCCSDKESGHCAEKKQQSTPVKWVLGFAARRCGGHGPIGAAQHSPSVSPKIPPSIRFEIAVVGTIQFLNWQAEPLPTVPAEPPPRGV